MNRIFSIASILLVVLLSMTSCHTANVASSKSKTERQAAFEAGLNARFDAERSTLKRYQEKSKTDAEPYISEAISQTVESLLQDKLPSDSDRIAKDYQQICSKNKHVVELQQVVKNNVALCLRELNDGRASFMKQQLVTYSKQYDIASVTVSVKNGYVKCPVSDLMALSKIQHKVDWASLGLSVASLLSPSAVLGLAVGAIDLYRTTKVKKESVQQMIPYYVRVAQMVDANMRQSINQEIDATFSRIEKQIETSQAHLKNTAASLY